MVIPPAIERMRAIRRDSYRCQARVGRRRCFQPAAWVVPIDPTKAATAENLLTVCYAHRIKE